MADEQFIAMYTDPVPWEPSDGVQGLAPGLEVKVLRRFEEDDDAFDALVRYPAGHVEPRHSHDGEHIMMIVEGTLLVDGRELGPSDYVYGPRGVPHGPLEFPTGAVLYVAHRGAQDPGTSAP